MDKADKIENLNVVLKQLLKDSKLEDMFLINPDDDEQRKQASRHISHRVREEVSKRLAQVDRSVETLIDLGFCNKGLEISSILFHSVRDLFDSLLLPDVWLSCLDQEEEDAEE